MSDQIYRKLAQRLDAIPNGFPAAASGIELRLLAHLFTVEEAELAGEMRLIFETAEEISTRVGLEPKQVYQTLKKMARGGLVRARKGAESALLRIDALCGGNL